MKEILIKKNGEELRPQPQTMPNYCVVPKCRGVGGFSFPADPDLNLKWREAIQKLDWTPSVHSRVCDKHFKAEDFKEPIMAGYSETGRTCRSLKDGAIPSVFSFADEEAASVKEESIDIDDDAGGLDPVSCHVIHVISL